MNLSVVAIFLSLTVCCNGFTITPPSTILRIPTSLSLTPLPRGISPFEKSLSKSIDIQANFRNIAKRAIDNAIKDGNVKIEVEFPPLLGGSKSKSQFDDFDNIQELDSNKDWTLLLAPTFLNDKTYQDGKLWLIFPDLKECELAKQEWSGQKPDKCTFTTIEAVTNYVASGGSNNVGNDGYDAPWGSSLISGLSKMIGGEDGDAGLLGDQAALDPIIDGENSPASLWLVIQPGNGGPVEDWVNLAKMSSDQTPVVIINGALDKVNGGFYPAFVFPKLAKVTESYYKKFESVFYIKPFSDKGVYGWLFRVYPEPWQVVYESVKQGKDGNAEVEYITVDVLDERPSYNTIISMLLNASQNN